MQIYGELFSQIKLRYILHIDHNGAKKYAKERAKVLKIV